MTSASEADHPSTFMQDRWHVAAWDGDLDRAPTSITVCDKPNVLYRWLDRSGFAEDEAILEAQQRSIEANPDLGLRASNSDAGGVWMRAVIVRLARATTGRRQSVAL